MLFRSTVQYVARERERLTRETRLARNTFYNTTLPFPLIESVVSQMSIIRTPTCFWDEDGRAKHMNSQNTLFDGVSFPYVDVESISSGFASVPVMVDDMGDKYAATMVAGSVGIQASVSSEATASDHQAGPTDEAASSSPVVRDTIQPVSGWWIFKVEDPEKTQAREAKKKLLGDQIEQLGEKLDGEQGEENLAIMDDMAQIRQELRKIRGF